MPLTADTPAQVGPTIDSYEITAFSVNLEAGLIRVNYRIGTAQPGDPQNPVLWVQDGLTFSFSTSDVESQTPDSALTYRANLKTLIYAKGQALGIFPAGAVS